MTSRAVKSGSSLDTQTLSFDGLDHLLRWNDTVTTSNEEWYMYDASGNRVLQRSTTGSGSSNTSITVYAFGLEEHLYNGAGTLTNSKYYYSLGGRLLGKTSGSGAPTFYLTDTLGSPLASFSGASGTSTVAGNQTYGPYGNVQYNKGLMGTAKNFTGQYKDDLSGLNDFGARYYDQLVGTFLSADTVQGNLLGDDPYAYVGGNPENFSDPTGQILVSSCYSQGCSGYAIPKITSTTTTWSSSLAGLFQAVTGSSGHTSSKTAGVGDANNGSGPACNIGCRSNIFVDNGSRQVPVISVRTPPSCLSLSGLGLLPCVFTGGVSSISFIRFNIPPSTFNYCPPPVGCGDEGSKDSSLEDGSSKESTIFADATVGPDGEPQNIPTEDAQAGQAGTPTDSSDIIKANIPEDKFRFIFGDATGSQHNLDRSNGLALQMGRLGVLDDAEGRELLFEHLIQAALDTTNVSDIRITNWGTFIEKESLFAGPSGKFGLFRSVWQVATGDELRFSTVVVLGGD